MSGPNDINKRIRHLRFRVDAETHDRILTDVLDVHADARKAAPRLASAIVRRFVMIRWIWRFSLAGIAIIIALALFLPFGRGGLVLADVLDRIQGGSYRFDLTIRLGQAHKTVQGQVYQQGRARFDDKVGVGAVSAIVDLESRRSLLLFHQFRTARYVEGSEELTNTADDQVLQLCSRPIEDLWHLRDSTEDDLGGENIDGVKAHGFRVVHEDDYFRNEVTLWATVRSAEPVTVEIVSTALKPPGNQMVFTLEDFVIVPNMDKSQFSLEVPAGYTLSKREGLEDVTFESDSSAEAESIAEVLRLWVEGKTEEAFAMLLTVDWDAAIVFAREPYLFTLTEQDIVEFKEDERERVVATVMNSCSVVRKICFESVERAKTARLAGDHAVAERHLESALHLGELLNRDPEGIFIAQLVGIAARKLALVQLKALYEEMDTPEKLVTTEQKIQQVDAEHQRLVKRNRG